MKENTDKGEIPPIEFLDSENYSSGNKDTITYASIVANQFNRCSVAAGRKESEEGDDFHKAVMALASLLKPYLKDEHGDIVSTLKVIQTNINTIKKTYSDKATVWKKKNTGKVSFQEMQFEMMELKFQQDEELYEQYLLLYSTLVTLWKDEDFFTESGAYA